MQFRVLLRVVSGSSSGFSWGLHPDPVILGSDLDPILEFILPDPEKDLELAQKMILIKGSGEHNQDSYQNHRLIRTRKI